MFKVSNKRSYMTCNKCLVHYNFCSLFFGQNDQKRKNQLYCLCLKMTADFGKFVAKTDKKPQLKDEMKQTKHDQLKKEKRKKKGNTGPCRFVYCLWRGGFLLDQ